MTEAELRSLSSEELIAQFVEIVVGQSDLNMAFQIDTYNVLYKDAVAIIEELQARPGDQRRLLVPLFEHDNPQVRSMAAKWCMALEPQRARQVLQDIHASGMYRYAGDAGMSLRGLDSGGRWPK